MANLSNINNKFLVTTGGNILIGKTAANNATVGAQIMSTGDINPTVSGDTVARFNRLSNDGEIIRFQQDTLTDGAINSLSGRIAIGSGTTGIFFDSIRDVVTPHNMTTNAYSANISLGRSAIPFKDLYLSGSSVFIDGAAYSSAASIRQQSSALIFSGGSNGYYFNKSDNSATHMFINSSGNIGIGTTNIGTQSNLYLGASSSSEGGQITLQKATGGTLAAHVDAYTSGGTDFMRVLSGTDTATSAAPFVFNLTNVRVGIGTANPTFKLDIVGTSPRIRVQENSSNTAVTQIEVENSDGRGAMLGIGGSARTDILTNRGYINAQTATDGLAIGTEGTDPIVFYTQGIATSNEKMRILDNGNVGIGTVLPGKKLEVSGSYKLGTNAYIEYGAGYPYTITTANTAAVGNLVFSAGLGSAAFESKIDLQGSNTAGAAGITLSTASTPRITITADGKIGLRKTDPYYDIDATDFAANSYAWGSGLAIFGQDRYNIRELNNLFYSANTRCAGIGSSSNLESSMFDGNFDSAYSIGANTTYVVEIDGSGVMNMTYPQGYAVISFYYIYNNYFLIVLFLISLFGFFDLLCLSLGNLSNDLNTVQGCDGRSFK